MSAPTTDEPGAPGPVERPQPSASAPGDRTRTKATAARALAVGVVGRPMLRAVAAGLLLAASLPPWGWWPLAFAGVALVDGLLAHAPWRSRLARGAVTGMALFWPTIIWIGQLTLPGYLFAVPFLGGMLGLFCVAVPPGSGRRPALVGAWVMCESLRAAWPFGGVPLSLLGVGQVGGPLASIARVGGALAITGATVAVGLVLAGAIARQGRAAAAALVSVVALLGLAGVAPAGRNTGTAIDITYVQGGGEQGTRAIDSVSREVFERHLEASDEVPSDSDLVLWPENVIDSRGDIQDAREGGELEALARRLDAPLLVGTTEGVSDTEFRNSQQVLDADGIWGDQYVKVQRVPFGEWVPFRSVIEGVAPDTLAPRDATVSTQSGLLRTDVAPVATVISWEVFFGHRARAAVNDGGQLLINPTNGSTYTGTFVQTQQLASSRLRAIETGRWNVQVAPTGFSAFVSPEGDVYQRSAISERAVETRRDVPLRTGETWYLRWGDTPARLVAVLLVAAGWVLDRRRT